MRSNKLQNYLTYHQQIHPFITQPCIIMHQTLINCTMMGHYNSALKMQITFKVSVWCKILRFDFIFDMVLPQMFSSNEGFFCKFIIFVLWGNVFLLTKNKFEGPYTNILNYTIIIRLSWYYFAILTRIIFRILV